MNTDTIYLLYFIILNVATFVIYGWDKHSAINHKWRVSEYTLITLALAGGSIGALAGMRYFKHKTRHLKFKYGLPLILILQIFVLVYFYRI